MASWISRSVIDGNGRGLGKGVGSVGMSERSAAAGSGKSLAGSALAFASLSSSMVPCPFRIPGMNTIICVPRLRIHLFSFHSPSMVSVFETLSLCSSVIACRRVLFFWFSRAFQSSRSFRSPVLLYLLSALRTRRMISAHSAFHPGLICDERLNLGTVCARAS